MRPPPTPDDAFSTIGLDEIRAHLLPEEQLMQDDEEVVLWNHASYTKSPKNELLPVSM